MLCRRRSSLSALLVCLSWLAPQALAQAQQPAAPKPTPPAAGQAKPAPAKPVSPFENVPASPEPAKPAAEQAKPAADPSKPQAQPAKPGLETPAPAPDAAAPAGEVADVIEAIEFRGSRRVPQDTLRALIFTKKGDPYSQETLSRDFMALWNTGRFDDIRMEREPGRSGWLIRFVVTERRVIRSIKYDGMKSITVSEILDRFKERKVGLQVEQQYDPNKVQRAANVLREYLAERGRQFATVNPDLRQIPPSSLEVDFKVNEGPKVKVGIITIENNKVFSDKEVIRAMKNLHPVGIPRSIIAENLFAKTFDSTQAGRRQGPHPRRLPEAWLLYRPRAGSQSRHRRLRWRQVPDSALLPQ